jgi:hypothetical protein
MCLCSMQMMRVPLLMLLLKHAGTCSTSGHPRQMLWQCCVSAPCALPAVFWSGQGVPPTFVVWTPDRNWASAPCQLRVVCMRGSYLSRRKLTVPLCVVLLCGLVAAAGDYLSRSGLKFVRMTDPPVSCIFDRNA